MENNLSKFDVQLYGDIQKFNEVASIARCRIFYKGENRNGGYITDQFAEKLISSIPYTPVKGIYIDDDYSDHGTSNDQGRIYGVVPKDYNLKWEEHIDDDGITRTYATVDVILYTEMYEEAKEITDKPQSMELYKPSIQGKWEFINGKKLYVYEEACFFGLQVLGDVVEPCFEGAAFYSLENSFKEFINKLDNYSMNNKQQEDNKLEINFKLSDDQKFTLIWYAINPNFSEEGNWTIEYSISAIYDDYALITNVETGKMERAYYIKNNETNEITLGDREDCFIVDVTEAELNALNAIQNMNNGTYELADQIFSRGQEFNEEKISEFEQKITELEENNTTLITERETDKENYTAQIEELNNQINELNSSIEAKDAQINEYNKFKLNIENEKKDSIIAKYSNKLSDEVIEKFTNSKEDYDIQALEEKLAFELVQTEPSLFSLDVDGIILKETSSEWDFLKKYEKNKN